MSVGRPPERVRTGVEQRTGGYYGVVDVDGERFATRGPYLAEADARTKANELAAAVRERLEDG